MFRHAIRALPRVRSPVTSRQARWNSTQWTDATASRERSRLSWAIVGAGGIGGCIAYALVTVEPDEDIVRADKKRSLSYSTLTRDKIRDVLQGQSVRTDSPKSYGKTFHGAEARGNYKIVDGVHAVTQGSETKDSGIFPDWSALGDKITDAVVPGWAKTLPLFIKKLQYELSMEDGTLADDMWKDAHDEFLHPEIGREASVRVSDDLCYEEQQYLQIRRLHTRTALANYLGVVEDDIHLDDIPVIGMCGSGGGLRAMVAGTSSYFSAQDAGLFDCITYTAGVSGSCWAQALYYSTLTDQNFGNLIKHLKARIGTHIAFPPPVLKLLTESPTNTYLMAGGLEKYKGVEDAEFGIVDIYGLLLAARLMIPKGELDLHAEDLKLSNQRKFVDSGQHPLPLYTAVRHEIPAEEQDQDANKNPPKKDITEVQEPKSEAWFQWFEFSPYEFYSEDFGAGIPTWAVGRSFANGHSTLPSSTSSDGPIPTTYLPELRLSLLVGIWGSAFCATLAHYYKEIRPLVKGLTGFGGLDDMLEDRNDDLARVHPVDPAQIPNFALGMRDQLPERCTDSVTGPSRTSSYGARNEKKGEDEQNERRGAKHIQLMDAGMSNNLPIYPLLRPGRNVDVLIVFDSSADIQKENWLRVVDGYAQRRGIEGWPAGAGFPVEGEEGPEAFREEHVADGMDEGGNGDGEAGGGIGGEKGTTAATTPSPAQEEPPHGTLGACTIWRGPSSEQNQNQGVTLIYFPLLPHPTLPNLDPDKTPFLSTWNFAYTPSEIDQVVALARANFREGEDKTKQAIRACWERKRDRRVAREASKSEAEIEWRIDVEA